MLIYLSRKMFRQYKKDKKGATAVEFALVAVPFLVFIFSILEMGMLFLSQTSLKNAVRETARLIRTDLEGTGARNFNVGQLTNELCNRSGFLPNCAANLTINQTVTPLYAPIPNGALTTSTAATSNAGNIVTIRIRYDWQMFGPVRYMFGDSHDGVLPVYQAMIFQNEPA